MVVISLIIVVIQQPVVVFAVIDGELFPTAPRLQRGVSGFEFATPNFTIQHLKSQISVCTFTYPFSPA